MTKKGNSLNIMADDISDEGIDFNSIESVSDDDDDSIEIPAYIMSSIMEAE